MAPVPAGYADATTQRLVAAQEPDITDGQAALPDAADRCWQQAVQEVADPVATLVARLPTAAADGDEAAAAEERHTACLAALGYAVDPNVPIDQSFFDQSMAIERACNDGTVTLDDGLEQLGVVQDAEAADAARRAPCDDELDRQIGALIFAEQQAVLDANPELLQPSAELTAAMAELQPYLDAVAD